MSLTLLPNELLFHLASFLKFEDLVTLSETCHSLKSYPSLWPLGGDYKRCISSWFDLPVWCSIDFQLKFDDKRTKYSRPVFNYEGTHFCLLATNFTLVVFDILSKTRQILNFDSPIITYLMTDDCLLVSTFMCYSVIKLNSWITLYKHDLIREEHPTFLVYQSKNFLLLCQNRLFCMSGVGIELLCKLKYCFDCVASCLSKNTLWYSSKNSIVQLDLKTLKVTGL